MRLFRRGGEGPWYAQWYGPDGTRYQRSTRCIDKRAAESTAREWERATADPAIAAANATTVSSALKIGYERGVVGASWGSLIVECNATGRWLLDCAALVGLGGKTAFGFGRVRVEDA